jgi:hypothetical protein
VADRCKGCIVAGSSICLDPTARACSRTMRKVPPSDKSLRPGDGTVINKRPSWWRRLLGVK